MVVVLGVLGVVQAPPAHAVQYETTVSFSSVSVGPDGVTLSGTVANTGTDALFRTQVVVWRDRTPLTTHEQLDAALAGDPEADTGDRILLDSSVDVISQGTETFDAGQQADFTVSASWEDLSLTQDGVYLVGVHVRAADVSWGSLVTIGRGRTLVTLNANGGLTGSSATVAMLTSAPSLVHDNVFCDDHLAGELSGRLSTLLAFAHTPGISWVIDPALFREISVMSEGYLVMSGDDLVPGSGQTQASAWLASFHTLSMASAYRLPWGNPDLAMGAAASDPSIVTASIAAGELYNDLTALPLLVRADNGMVDNDFLDYIAPLKPQIVLAETSSNAEYGPTAILSTLADPFPGGPGPDAPGTALQRIQRAIAEDALTPDTVIRVIQTEEDVHLASQPLPSWVTPMGLAPILVNTPWEPGLSAGQALGTLTVASLDSVAAIQASARTYASLIRDDEQGASLVAVPAALAVSQSWDEDESTRTYAAAVSSWIDSILGQVTLTANSNVTLTSHTASFPVTVTNKLDVPVYVRITSQTQHSGTSLANVSIPYTDVQPIQPGDKLSASLSPVVLREGDVTVLLSLTTQDGYPLGSQAPVLIHADGSAWMGWAVVGAAIVLAGVGTVLRVKSKRSTAPPVPGDEGRSVPGDEVQPAE